MKSCPCGFEAAPNVSPSSPAWHRQHKAKHLAVYPKVDQRTHESLDELIASAERRNIVALVDSKAVANGRPRKAVRT